MKVDTTGDVLVLAPCPAACVPYERAFLVPGTVAFFPFIVGRLRPEDEARLSQLQQWTIRFTCFEPATNAASEDICRVLACDWTEALFLVNSTIADFRGTRPQGVLVVGVHVERLSDAATADMLRERLAIGNVQYCDCLTNPNQEYFTNG
jgi:hypothetical protein